MPGVFYKKIAKWAFSRPKSPKLWVSLQESPKSAKRDTLAGGTSPGTFTTEEPSFGFYNTLPINGHGLNFQLTEGCGHQKFSSPGQILSWICPCNGGRCPHDSVINREVPFFFLQNALFSKGTSALKAMCPPSKFEMLPTSLHLGDEDGEIDHDHEAAEH